MEENKIQIRAVSKWDAEELLEVYAPYIRDTAVTFEYEVPSAGEFRERICRVQEKYPYLAAVEAGRIAGYAYAGRFHERAAFAWAVETSIYIRNDQKGKGIGRELYGMLEKILAAQGVLNLNASIACSQGEDPYLTRDSIRFHEHLGYRYVGEFHQCGFKFGRWYNLMWMEKHIGVHGECQLPVKSFDEVRGKYQL